MLMYYSRGQKLYEVVTSKDNFLLCDDGERCTRSSGCYRICFTSYLTAADTGINDGVQSERGYDGK